MGLIIKLDTNGYGVSPAVLKDPAGERGFLLDYIAMTRLAGKITSARGRHSGIQMENMESAAFLM